MLIPFARHSRPADYAAERVLNYFFHPQQEPSQGALLGRSGLVRLVQLSGPVRAMVELGSALFVAAGSKLWRVQPGVSAVQLGTIADDAFTSMDAIAGYVVLAAGGRYYVGSNSGVAQYSTGQVSTARAVCALDGYVAVAGSDATRGDRIALSNVDNPFTFDGLDFATAETLSDRIVGMVRDHTEIQVIGSRSVQTYYNSGDQFPLSPNDGAFAERGCANGATIAKTDSGVYWLGDDMMPYRRYGGAPEIIGSAELNEYLAGQSVVGGFAFQDRGRKFYGLRLADGPSWVYNIATGLWSEYSTGADHGPWRATAACMIDGVQYIGTADGSICTLGGWEDDGEVIRAEAWTVPITEQWTQLNRVEIHMDTGKGALGRDRAINLELSRDGKQWGAPKPRSLGDQGAYRRVARWDALGRYRDHVQARWWITDPVQRDIYGGRIA